MRCLYVNICFLLIGGQLLFAETVKSQSLENDKIKFGLNSEVLEDGLREVERLSGFHFIYKPENVLPFKNIRIPEATRSVKQTLDLLLGNTSLKYKQVDQWYILLTADPEVTKATVKNHVDSTKLVSGLVFDDGTGESIPGATVTNKSSGRIAISDKNGSFQIAAKLGDVISVSFIGYTLVEVTVSKFESVKVQLQKSSQAMKEVVVTGIFNRKKETFTGSAVSFSAEELLKVSNQNIIQALRQLDPSFVKLENNLVGSDPNNLPDVQIRGASSLPDLTGEYKSNPNAPLFILDGFESTLQKVYDLDINRVASVTILKDAAAKAIYGSRAANGVIVIETKAPLAGKMRISYTADVTVNAPDLTSYNLTNAADKLALELSAGRYTTIYQPETQGLLEQYNETYKNVVKGVNTYWLSQPLQTSIGQKHSLYLEGGDTGFRYGVDLSYNNIPGVMKKSSRETTSGTVNLSYRLSKFIFKNLLTVSFNKANDSPYGSYAQYTRLNSYWSAYDDNGNLKRILGSFDPVGSLIDIQYANPLYNATLGTKNFSKYTEITNNFYSEWNILNDLKLTGRFGFSNKSDTREDFYPANHTRYIDYAVEDYFKRGDYTITDGLAQTIKTDLTLNYSRKIAKHLFFVNGGTNFLETNSSIHGLAAQGFLNDRVDYISFARQYLENGRPTGSEGTTREISFLGAFNYSYNERYLLDLSIRRTGSSVFGANKRWGDFWSAGLGWNLHREKFLQDKEWIKQLKLRGSYGYTGSQNFNPYQALSTYNYYTDVYYDNVVSAKLIALGNPDLKWQQTRDINFGIDAQFLKRFSLRFDYYISNSDNLLIDLSLPGSIGFSSYKENLGEIQNKGFDATLNFKAYSNVRKEAFINLYVSAAHNENKILKLSNALNSYNDAQDASKSTKPLQRYIEGQSVNVIWAVPSLGIDPITGAEIFQSKDGTTTYVWKASDQVAAGENSPILNGSFGLNMGYKSFGLNLGFLYRYGGQYYNQTLVDRVENVDIQYNVDNRVFTDTWKQVGDVAIFKRITATPSKTYATTRFVEDLNELTMSSINVSYDFKNHLFLKRTTLKALRISGYTTDLFRVATVKTERGLNYPFARSFSLSLKATF